MVKYGNCEITSVVFTITSTVIAKPGEWEPALAEQSPMFIINKAQGSAGERQMCRQQIKSLEVTDPSARAVRELIFAKHF